MAITARMPSVVCPGSRGRCTSADRVAVIRQLASEDHHHSCWSTTTGAILAALIAGRRVAKSAALPSTMIVPR